MLDLLSPAHVADPFPLYARLREEPPFFYEPLGSWVFFRHADVVAGFTSKQLSADRSQGLVLAQAPQCADQLQEFVRVLSRTCLMSDGRYHAQARGVVQEGLSPKAMARHRAMIQSELEQVLDALEAAAPVDLMAGFARTFPSNVIARVMGVPEDMQLEFCRWTVSGTRLFGSVPLSTEVALEAQQAVLDMLGYFVELSARRRAQPTDDLASRLVVLGDSAGLSEHEVAILCLEVVGAAHNTSLDFMGNALHTLLLNRPAWDAVLADPTLTATAVEELLRMAGGLLFMNRIAIADLELGGAEVQAGQLVTLFQAAANRDPAVFADPERFDVRRGNARQHVSFGSGPHYCLGAPLARMEAELVVQGFGRRFPDMRLVEDQTLRYRPGVQSRGLEALWVHLR